MVSRRAFLALALAASSVLACSGGRAPARQDVKTSGQVLLADTIASLRARKSAAGSAALVAAYSAIGDGGGGTFWWSDSAATDDGGIVINAGGIGSSSAGWRRTTTGSVNVRWFGAKGDGTTADDSAIDLAIRAVAHGSTSSASGGLVYLPAGNYFVTTSIVVLGYEGLTLQGASTTGTAIIPAASLDGRPIIQFVNSRNCRVEDMWIVGRTGSARPPSGIESLSSGATSQYSSTNLHLRNIRIGAVSSNSIWNGVQFTAEPGYDANNDNGVIEDVEVIDFSNAAVYLGHSNSLAHRIVGGRFANGPYGVQLNGGSFAMYGTNLYVNEAMFDFEAANGGSSSREIPAAPDAGKASSPMTWAWANRKPSSSTPRYYHPSTVVGIATESPAAILQAAQGASGVSVHFSDCDINSGTPNRQLIKFEASGASDVTFVNCHLNVGQPGVSAIFKDPSSSARFIACELGITDVSWAGRLILEGNRWYPATVRMSPEAGAVLQQSLDDRPGGGSLEPTPPRAGK